MRKSTLFCAGALALVTTFGSAGCTAKKSDTQGSEQGAPESSVQKSELGQAATLYMEAMNLLQSDLYSQAQNKLEQAVELEPDYQSAYYHLGHIALRKKNYSKAQKHFEKTLSFKNSSLDSRYLLALSLFRQEKFTPSYQNLEQYLKEQDKDGNAWLLKAVLSLKLQKDKTAEEALAKAEALDAPSQPLLFNKGILAYRKGNYKSSRDLFKKALDLKPDSNESHYELARAELALKQLDKALESAQKAIEHAKDEPPSQHHQLVAEIARAQGNFPLAHTHLEQILDKGPDTLLAQARLAIDEKKTDLALKLTVQALQKEKPSPSTLKKSITIAQNLKRLDKVESWSTMLLKQQPKNHALRWQRAQTAKLNKNRKVWKQDLLWLKANGDAVYKKKAIQQLKAAQKATSASSKA